jgi:pseudoazurin
MSNKHLKTLFAVAVFLLASSSFAENFQVKMLNSGAEGVMVFEPSVLKISQGDSVTFKATNPGHNSASINGMIPEGVEAWSGGMSQDITVNFDQEGVYVYQCTPHLMMAMVGVIQVGSGLNLEAIKAKAVGTKTRFMMANDRLDSYLSGL